MPHPRTAYCRGAGLKTPMSDLQTRIEAAVSRARELETELSDPGLAKKPGQYQKLAKELGGLRPLVEVGERYQQTLAELVDSTAMTSDDDPELAELAAAEVETLTAQRAELEAKLGELLAPKDPNDEKNAILEIRAGTGGEEAGLFAGDLFRMYTRYAELRNWKIERLSSSETGTGAMKEVIVELTGDGAYGRLKNERGVHRVQRVPATES